MNLTPTKLFIGSIVAFLILYFGFSKVSPEVLKPEKSGIQNNIDTYLDAEVINLKDSLEPNDRAKIELLEQRFAASSNDTLKLEELQKISGFWYQQGHVGIAADYARKIALLMPNGENWSIASTNYILAAKQPNAPAEKLTIWVEKAKDGFKQAQLLEPTTISHQLNHALVNVEFPPQDQPMTGILDLRKLNETYPENTLIIYHLARLAIQTGQFDRASERLDALLKIDPEFYRAYCLKMEIAKHDKDLVALEKWTKKCQTVNN